MTKLKTILNEANMNSDELKRLRQIKEGLKYLENDSLKSMQFLHAFDVAIYAIHLMNILTKTGAAEIEEGEISIEKYKNLIIKVANEGL